jgi:hypothetical protein
MGIVLQSDTDEQLLIQILFQQGELLMIDYAAHHEVACPWSVWQDQHAAVVQCAAVKLQSITIASNDGDQAPRRVKLFINRSALLPTHAVLYDHLDLQCCVRTALMSMSPFGNAT